MHWPVQGSRAGWQLVLLDHGLYRKLDDKFRLEYAGLWRSLIFAGLCGCWASFASAHLNVTCWGEGQSAHPRCPAASPAGGRLHLKHVPLRRKGMSCGLPSSLPSCTCFPGKASLCHHTAAMPETLDIFYDFFSCAVLLAFLQTRMASAATLPP